MNGVLAGLAKFASPTRVALVSFDTRTSEGSLYDPMNLLEEPYDDLSRFIVENASTYLTHRERFLRRLLVEVGASRTPIVNSYLASKTNHLQIWFVEKQLGWSSEKVIERYLWLAAEMLESALRRNKKSKRMPEPHGSAVEYLGEAAIARQLTMELENDRVDFKGEPTNLLDNIKSLSTSLEEGERASGKIAIMDPASIVAADWITKFSKKTMPKLSNSKHTRKIMTIVQNTGYLVSDGENLVGLARKIPHEKSIVATFKFGRGVINVASGELCSFADGALSFRSQDAQLNTLRRLLKRFAVNDIDSVQDFVDRIVQEANRERHGCTVLIDLAQENWLTIPGHLLSRPVEANEGNWQFIKAMSRVDGAIHIDPDLNVRAFGCLLDGNAVVESEDPARGSRYNSALRYTAKEDDAIVITVSEDGPISIFHKGRLVNKRKPLKLIEKELSPIILKCKQFD